MKYHKAHTSSLLLSPRGNYNPELGVCNPSCFYKYRVLLLLNISSGKIVQGVQCSEFCINGVIHCILLRLNFLSNIQNTNHERETWKTCLYQNICLCFLQVMFTITILNMFPYCVSGKVRPFSAHYSRLVNSHFMKYLQIVLQF